MATQALVTSADVSADVVAGLLDEAHWKFGEQDTGQEGREQSNSPFHLLLTWFKGGNTDPFTAYTRKFKSSADL